MSDSIPLREYMDSKLQTLEERITRGFSSLERRLDEQDSRYVTHDRFNALERDVSGKGGAMERVEEVEKRIGKLELRYAGIATGIGILATAISNLDKIMQLLS